MTHNIARGAYCRTIVDSLDQEEGWRLSEADKQYYTAALGALANGDWDCSQLRAMAVNFHYDHTQVAALADPHAAGHHDAWGAWMARTLAILRNLRLTWTYDQAVDEEDLVQVARTALAGALARFRYQSRFSTWAHRVIAQSVQRYLRDLRALKRDGRPTSFNSGAEINLPVRETEQPECAVAAGMLAEHVAAILAAQPDRQLAVVFRLWAIDDLRVEAISRIVRLQPARVRYLLSRARHILRRHPTIQAWHDDQIRGVGRV